MPLFLKLYDGVNFNDFLFLSFRIEKPINDNTKIMKQFIDQMCRFTALTDAEKELLASFLTHKTIRKKQYFLQTGDICRYSAFVLQGCLRAYTVDKSGSDHIIQFAVAGWTISDMFSFLTEAPAIYNIDALQDTEVLLLNKKDKDLLLEQIPKFEKVFRVSLENNYIVNQRRINSLLSDSVEERYRSFIDTYPDISQQVPQHMIASYIGSTPETLSRIRRKIGNQK